MALALAATLTFSATKVILTNTTGDYDVSDNPGGYGSPNAEFTDYAHYAIIRKKNVNGVADSVLTLDSYNPVSAVSFSADRSVDGWHEGKLLEIEVWDIGTAYTGGTALTGSVVEDDGVVYYCEQNNTGNKPSLNPSDWEPVTDLTTIEENPFVLTKFVGRVTPYNADVYWSTKMAENSQAGRCGICADSREKERLDKIYFHIQAVLVADQLGSNTDGEFNVLALLALGAL